MSDWVGRSCVTSSVPERTLRQRSSRSAKASSSWPPRLSGASGQSARGQHRCAHHRHGGLAWDTKGEAGMVDHGGHQGATHDAAGNEGREHDPKRLPKALTEARNCPSDATSKIFLEKVPVDAHVVHELGHVRALPGEDHLRKGMIDTANRQRRTPAPWCPTLQ